MIFCVYLGDIEQISKDSLKIFLPVLTAKSLNEQISNIKLLFQVSILKCI